MPLILFSTNCWLAYKISEKYYSDIHYVWCTPDFAEENSPKLTAATPPTSTPKTIYENLGKEVEANDKHSGKIKELKLGLLKGAQINRTNGLISAEQEADIIYIVGNAEISDFRPLLYIIPYEMVKDLLEEVPVGERAHPLSVEYRIEKLPGNLFNVIEF
jgi:hypothetical protein